MSRPIPSRLLCNLCACTLTLFGGWAHAETPTNSTGKSVRTAEAALDSEFWELYEEPADEQGQLPAPEDIPPPKESITPSSPHQADTALEVL